MLDHESRYTGRYVGRGLALVQDSLNSADGDFNLGNISQSEILCRALRVLFDSAAGKWYSAVTLQLLSGALAVGLSFADIGKGWSILTAALVFGLFTASYLLRLWAEQQYSLAEKMRRSYVMWEGLGWDPGGFDMDDLQWSLGQRNKKKIKAWSRAPDPCRPWVGQAGPYKLALITRGSARSTRFRYVRLRRWIWGSFALSVAMSFAVVSTVVTRGIPESTSIAVARSAYSFMSLVLATNVLGWGLRLGRLIPGIRAVEEGLERLMDAGSGLAQDQLPQVLRLVSEYNCQVIGGLPLHRLMFYHWFLPRYERPK